MLAHETGVIKQVFHVPIDNDGRSSSNGNKDVYSFIIQEALIENIGQCFSHTN